MQVEVRIYKAKQKAKECQEFSERWEKPGHQTNLRKKALLSPGRKGTQKDHTSGTRLSWYQVKTSLNLYYPSFKV